MEKIIIRLPNGKEIQRKPLNNGMRFNHVIVRGINFMVEQITPDNPLSKWRLFRCDKEEFFSKEFPIFATNKTTVRFLYVLYHNIEAVKNRLDYVQRNWIESIKR